eukprot:UN16477
MLFKPINLSTTDLFEAGVLPSERLLSNTNKIFYSFCNHVMLKFLHNTISKVSRDTIGDPRIHL